MKRVLKFSMMICFFLTITMQASNQDAWFSSGFLDRSHQSTSSSHHKMQKAPVARTIQIVDACHFTEVVEADTLCPIITNICKLEMSDAALMHYELLEEHDKLRRKHYQLERKHSSLEKQRDQLLIQNKQLKLECSSVKEERDRAIVEVKNKEKIAQDCMIKRHTLLEEKLEVKQAMILENRAVEDEFVKKIKKQEFAIRQLEKEKTSLQLQTQSMQRHQIVCLGLGLGIGVLVTAACARYVATQDA